LTLQLKLVSFVIVLTVLTGCEAVPVKKGQASEPVKANTASSEAQGKNTPQSSNAPRGSSPVTNSDQVNYLSGQLLTMQEQVIQIKADTSELRQNAQVMLARLEMLNNQSAPPSDKGNVGVSSVQQQPLTPQSVDQLTAQLNSLLAQTQSNFELVSGYTAKGQWVLIRYDRFTGETWLADQNRWKELDESDALAPSLYEVQVHRADKDIKGYVAARIDQKTGQTWWLRESMWQNFQ